VILPSNDGGLEAPSLKTIPFSFFGTGRQSANTSASEIYGITGTSHNFAELSAEL
jgi:hypothetical protein